jgi:hypothetical protein
MCLWKSLQLDLRNNLGGVADSTEDVGQFALPQGAKGHAHDLAPSIASPFVAQVLPGHGIHARQVHGICSLGGVLHLLVV